jgi:hypothetical protein
MDMTEKVAQAMAEKLNFRQMEKVQKAMEGLGLLFSLLPEMEIKDIERTFKNPKDPAKPIVKQYVAIYIEKPEKKAQ